MSREEGLGGRALGGLEPFVLGLGDGGRIGHGHA
jgi:hypothetical protein